MNKKEQRMADKAAKAAAEKAALIAAADDVAGNTTTPEPEAKPEPVEAKAKKPSTTAGLPALPPMPKAARKPKPAKVCECGCGGSTRGGRFIPGHDSYLKSWALRVERGVVAIADVPDGHREAVEKLLKIGTGTTA